MNNLSEEEIIETIEEIKNSKTLYWYGEDRTLSIYLSGKQADAIEGLLDLYNKEKEKNKDLMQDNIDLINLYKRTAKHLVDIGKEEMADYFYAQIGECPTIGTMDIIRKYDFVSKDKIRNKIQELEDIKLCGSNIHKTIIEDEIKLLQELLEE